jgi:hypothetical protein
MPPHPYLRAYMAGVVIPSVTIFLVALPVAGFFSRIPVAIERAMLFPMALNPGLWGAWNVLYVALRPTRRLPIGWHGAALALLLVLTGIVLAGRLHVSFVTPTRALAVLPPTTLAYYVLWRFALAPLNDILGVSSVRTGHRERA